MEPPFVYGYGGADMPYRGANTQEGIKPLLTGSYGFNGWVDRGGLFAPRSYPLAFKNESTVSKPTVTPVFADCMVSVNYPRAIHPPGRNLYTVYNISSGAMAEYIMARHGGRGTAHSSMPVEPGQPLGPYVNNIAFFDGHVEPIKLDHLWNLYWHADYEPPDVRPP